MIMLTPKIVKALESILSKGMTAQIGVRNGNVVVWQVKSKKELEQPVQ